MQIDWWNIAAQMGECRIQWQNQIAKSNIKRAKNCGEIQATSAAIIETIRETNMEQHKFCKVSMAHTLWTAMHTV